MGSAPGRKGIILFSSGLDTFSKATYEDALSGGRLHSPQSTIDPSPIHDEMIGKPEGGYVVTFKSPGGGSNVTHTPRVDLVGPASDKPLEISHAAGRSIHANVIVQTSYTTAVTVHR